MDSYPSPGDALPRMLAKLRDQLRRLVVRQNAMATKIAALEARVTDLEGP